MSAAWTQSADSPAAWKTMFATGPATPGGLRRCGEDCGLTAARVRGGRRLRPGQSGGGLSGEREYGIRGGAERRHAGRVPEGARAVRAVSPVRRPRGSHRPSFCQRGFRGGGPGVSLVRPGGGAREFRRILKAGGWVALIWNERASASLGVPRRLRGHTPAAWDRLPEDPRKPRRRGVDPERFSRAGTSGERLSRTRSGSISTGSRGG